MLFLIDWQWSDFLFSLLANGNTRNLPTNTITVNSRSLYPLTKVKRIGQAADPGEVLGRGDAWHETQRADGLFRFQTDALFFNPVPDLVFYIRINHCMSELSTFCHDCFQFITRIVFVCLYVPKFLLAPVSSLRLKYVYKSAAVKDEANTTKQASLIESLTNSEVNLISSTFYTDVDRLNRTHSSSLLGEGWGKSLHTDIIYRLWRFCCNKTLSKTRMYLISKRQFQFRAMHHFLTAYEIF